MNPRNRGGVWFAVAAAAFLAVVAYVVVTTVLGSDLANAGDDAAVFLFGVVALFSLVGWWWSRAGAAAALTESEDARGRLEVDLRKREENLRESRDELGRVRGERNGLRQEKARLESGLEARDGELQRERYLRARSLEAQQAERDWKRELQDEVVRMHRELGALGDPGDVPGMVLRLSKKLLGADKGLLLSRADEDSDGRLDLISSEGFENDPADSALAQRFADSVIENDRIILEDEPQEVEGSALADAEIENLVAIPIYVQDEFSGVIVCANKEGGFGELDRDVLLSLGNQAGAVLKNGQLQGELRSSYLATVRVLGEALEAKDPFLRGHSEEVSGYVAAVTDRLGVDAMRREQLLFASLLHDVGKIGISERILLKPAVLTQEELDVVKLHPRIGYHIVQQVPALEPMALGILHHHERYDGQGYPSGLRGEEIPFEARIICVADAFSAMTAERPYRRRMPVAEACAELERHAGTQFDPEIVRVFVNEVRKKPPGEDRLRELEDALEDPELQARRRDGEPVLGYGALALTDNLTMLYTRRYLQETARSEALRSEERGRPFGVMIVELTEIGRTNALKGYAAGDEEIRAAARGVQRVAARIGGTACRHGGRRLALVASETDEEGARRLAAQIVAGLTQGPAQGPPVRVGSAAWRPGDDGDSVVVRAKANLA